MNYYANLHFAISIFLCALLWQNTSAQVVPTVNTSYSEAVINTLNNYNKGIGNLSGLINGPIYYYYDRRLKGDAYYGGYEWRNANLYYDGAYYKDIPILYDVVKDVVVVQAPDKMANYSLVNWKLIAFKLLNHNFITVKTDSTITNIKGGIYDVLYAGKSLALSKTTKTIQNTSSIGVIENSFTEHRSYFVRKDNSYYEIGGEGDLLKAFKEKKKELQQYIKSSGIKYRKDPEDAIIKIATYFDHLTE